MKTAIYPGSFDPVTLGHLDILERASRIFDHVTVVVMQSRRKDYWFSPEKRVEMLWKSAGYLSNVTVDRSDSLLADYCAQKRGAVVVKGLRAMSDFELEFQMTMMNRKLNHTLDTVFLMAGERFQYLSSSAVKEVASFGGNVFEFIPPEIADDVISCVQTRKHMENQKKGEA